MSQPPPGTESKTLLAYLNAERKHVLGVLEGLDEEAATAAGAAVGMELPGTGAPSRPR